MTELDQPGLQSLAVRLGRFAWTRSTYPADLADLSSLLLRQRLAAADSLNVIQRAYLDVANDVVEALALGDETVGLCCDSLALSQIGWQVMRAPANERVVDIRLVRSILESLLAGDRSAFRSVLGALGGELTRLDAMAIDGPLKDLYQIRSYQELRALQAVMNGILRASRTGVGQTPQQETVSV